MDCLFVFTWMLANYQKLYLFELLQTFGYKYWGWYDKVGMRRVDTWILARIPKTISFWIATKFWGRYDKVERRRFDRLFIDTRISGQEAVDVFTWTNATLIRLLQLQKKKHEKMKILVIRPKKQPFSFAAWNKNLALSSVIYLNLVSKRIVIHITSA